MEDPTVGLRRRRHGAADAGNPAAQPPQVVPPQPEAAAEPDMRQSLSSFSRFYCIMSALLAVLAIVVAPTTLSWENLVEQQEDGAWFSSPTVTVEEEENKIPPWLRWIIREEQSEPEEAVFYTAWIDSVLLQTPTLHTATFVIDKVITSIPRLVVMTNFFISMTFLLHSLIVDWFLGPRREAGAKILIFKLMLVRAIAPPDNTLSFLLMVTWYTLISFFRSLVQHCANTTQHTLQSGQPPKAGVWQLLTAVLICNTITAAGCVALFHQAGANVVLLLTCECLLLAFEIIANLLMHAGQELDEQHALRVARVEAARRPNVEQQVEVMEQRQVKRISFLEHTIFLFQLCRHLLNIVHYLHLWGIYGLRWSLIDGVLALNLQSSIAAASKKIAERRNLNRIAREMDDIFEDATELDLQKANATGDVCCICLGNMSCGNVKKLGCGHLYHTQCLREVVERARSIEDTKCPLCRSSIQMEAVPPEAANNPSAQGDGAPQDRQQQEQGRTANPAPGDLALFRFSTDNILPTWIPLPSFSFEIVRRPSAARNNAADENANDNANGNAGRNRQRSFFRHLLVIAGIVPMTPEEEAETLEQLVDMFPQYDRADLRRALQARGSAEAVTESIFAGTFQGNPRG